jgi:phosphoglycerate dehydrogenase-like enzyme
MDSMAWRSIYGPKQHAQIAEMVEVLAPVMSPDEALRRPELLREMDVLISGWGGPVLDKSFLARAPKLKAFFYGAGTVRRLLSHEFWERKIVLTTANTANAIPVAEFSLAHILLGLKRAFFQAVEVKKIRTFPETRIPTAGAYESTVGLISLSTIGRLVRKHLAHFDVQVIACDPTVTRAQAATLKVELVSLSELFFRSDVISLHAPHLPETEGLITGALLAKMKPGATFINTARGALIREAEMIEVLSARPDLTAVLDVTCPEPPEKTSRLYDLPNVILTPHIAGSIENECQRMGQWVADELRRYLAGEPLKSAITSERASLMA